MGNFQAKCPKKEQGSLSPTETNFDVGNQELLAVQVAMGDWPGIHSWSG